MLFRPRQRPPLHRRARSLVWPRRGWRRAGTYVFHRLQRLPGSPAYIATGFAFGAAVSFTPFIGLHFLIGAILTWLFGGSIIASAIGTAVGNPWTFPFIWIATHRLGVAIIGGPVTEALPEDLSIKYIFEHSWSVLAPMSVGGIIMGGVAWFVSYWIMKSVVARYQAIRRDRLRRSMDKRSIGQPMRSDLRDRHGEH